MSTANGRVVMIKDQDGNSIAFVETTSVDHYARRLEGLAD
jgi:hypothetical protein